MRLYKRGTTYHFELDFNGKQYRKSTKSKNLRTAQQYMTAFHQRLVLGEAGIVERKPAPSLESAMKNFLAWSKQEHTAHPATAERYVYSSKPLLAHFAKSKSLDVITPEDVEVYKQKRANQFRPQEKGKHKRKVSPATVNRELACLRACFNHAAKGCPDLRNPIRKIGGAKLLPENNLQERVLTHAEEAKYLTAASPILRDVATLILEGGERPEEIFMCRPEHVDLDRMYLRILKGKTPAARRRIELTEKSAEVFRRRITLAAEAGSPWLFWNSHDPQKPLPGLQSAHARALKESKVARFRPYDLRHTWATRAAEAGVDLLTLAAMMGHSRVQMVMRYAHPTQEHQTTAMARIVQHKRTQAAAEKARTEAAAQRANESQLHVVTKSA